MPALFALLASALFGAAMILTRFGLRVMDSTAGALVSVPSTTLLFWGLAPFLLPGQPIALPALAIFAAVGLAFPGLVTLLVFESNLRLGPTPTATLSATSPVFAVAGAILFIGERLTVPVVLGTAAVAAGIVLLSWRRGGGDRWRLPVLGLPLAGAVIRALAQVGTKLGLVLLPSPYVAGLVGYTLSVATLLAVARLRYRGRPIRLHRRGVPWFVLAGFCNGIAVLSLYTALNTGPVSVAAPIVATFPVFTLLFSVLFLRQEALRWPALAGVGLVVAGVVRIVV